MIDITRDQAIEAMNTMKLWCTFTNCTNCPLVYGCTERPANWEITK
jgi:hypothetical protein